MQVNLETLRVQGNYLSNVSQFLTECMYEKDLKNIITHNIIDPRKDNLVVVCNKFRTISTNLHIRVSNQSSLDVYCLNTCSFKFNLCYYNEGHQLVMDQQGLIQNNFIEFIKDIM